MSIRQSRIKIDPRMKLNHNITATKTWQDMTWDSSTFTMGLLTTFSRCPWVKLRSGKYWWKLRYMLVSMIRGGLNTWLVYTVILLNIRHAFVLPAYSCIRIPSQKYQPQSDLHQSLNLMLMLIKMAMFNHKGQMPLKINVEYQMNNQSC